MLSSELDLKALLLYAIEKMEGNSVNHQNIDQCVALCKSYLLADSFPFSDATNTLSLLSESIAEVAIICDRTFNIKYVSPSVSRVFGVSPSDFTNSNLLSYFVPEAGLVLKEELKKQQQGAKQGNDSNRVVVVEAELVQPTSSVVWIELSARLMGVVEESNQQVHCIVRDITQRKENENRLKRAEERYRLLFSNIKQGYALHEIIIDDYGKPCDYRFIDFNPAYESLTGLKLQEAVGKTVLEIFPDLEQFWIDLYGEVAIKGKPKHIQQYTKVLDAYYDVWAFCPQENLFAVVFSDVTEHVRATNKLKESVSRNSAIVKALPDLLFMFNQNGDIVDFEASNTNLLYTPKEQFLGKNVTDVLPPSIASLTLKKIEETLCGADVSVYTYTLNVNGEERYFESRMVKSSHNEVLSVVRDITEREKALSKLLTLSKGIDQSPVSIVITDANGIIEFANPKFYDLTGYTALEVLGSNPRIFKSGHHPKQFYTDLWDTIKSGKEWKGEFCNKKKSGELFWEQAFIAPILSQRGEITQFIAVKEDITLRKQTEQILRENEFKLKEQNEEYLSLNEELSESNARILRINAELSDAKRELEEREHLFIAAENMAQLGHYTLDIANNCWTCSSMLESIFGITTSFDKSVESWLQIVHPEFRDELYTYLINEVLCEKREFNYEYKIVRVNDGAVRWVHGQGTLDIDSEGNPVKLFGVIQDITDRKQSEDLILQNQQLLIAQNEEYVKVNNELRALNDRIQALNAELQKSTVKAQESDRLKTAFLANISHEIRTPMNGIMGFSQLMLEANISPEKMKQYAQVIFDSSNQLLTIVTDTLNIALIESQQVVLDESDCCINDLLVDVYNSFKELVTKSGLHIYCKKELSDRDSTILCDGAKLKQVLSNLIGNALKFTQEGSITFGYTLRSNFLQFFVEDTGIGINPEYHNIIFESYRQVDESSTKLYGGTGVGLAICKALVEQMGGRIWVDSQVGRGSIFLFTLPYNNVLPLMNSESASSAAEMVLVVEDEEVNFLFIDEMLSHNGYKVLHSSNGQDAVEQCLSNSSIAVVLMDIKMPVMNGYDAVQEIKKHKPNLPIIAQTAYALNEDKQKILKSGFDFYVSKPINPKELLGILSTLFAKKHSV